MDESVRSAGAMVLTGETGAPGERPVCPSALSSTTQPPWADLELNPGLRGERLTFWFCRLTLWQTRCVW